jgi:hypothetical protein
MEVPHLIEPTTKYYLYETLKKCHTNRTTTYYYVLNIGIFVFLCGFTIILLYYCYNNKLSDSEKRNKIIKDQEYVLSKIRYFQDENQKSKLSRIPTLGGGDVATNPWSLGVV